MGSKSKSWLGYSLFSLLVVFIALAVIAVRIIVISLVIAVPVLIILWIVGLI